MATTVPNTTVPPRFSPWLSLAAPHLCPDEGGKDGTMTPYAVLHLFLDRAHGLPPADLNGLSDPYVTAQINDMDVDVRSRTQNNTLAPRWGQSFYISVYRPESILTLFVHDEDFGHEDTVGFAGSLVGLSDDLLGIVDISLDKLPLNTKLSGWFELQRVCHANSSYLTRVANAHAAVPAGRIRLQLTLCVAEPHHELYALCLGPPTFREPLKPLDLGELLSQVSIVAHDLGLVGGVVGPLITRAERVSSLVFGTAILLVWRPHYILPLIILALCILLLSQSNEWNETSTEISIADPALNKVFKAAETGLAAHQLTEICTVQNNLGACVESIRQCQRVWYQAVSHKFSVSVVLCLLAMTLIYFSEWQALFLRLSVTCVLAVLLAKHSCVARILRALYIYKSKDTISKGCLGLGVTLEAVDLSSELRRSATSYLTPDAADSLSNRASPVTNTPAAKPSMHVLEESSWSEPMWCKHCGGFLWGVFRQGWTCRECGVVLCHDCAAENDLDFCPKAK